MTHAESDKKLLGDLKIKFDEEDNTISDFELKSWWFESEERLVAFLFLDSPHMHYSIVAYRLAFSDI